MWRSHSCCEATNARGECGRATNVRRTNVAEPRMLRSNECPEDECPLGECASTNAVGERLAEFSSIRFAFQVFIFNVGALVSNVFTFC